MPLVADLLTLVGLALSLLHHFVEEHPLVAIKVLGELCADHEWIDMRCVTALPPGFALQLVHIVREGLG